MTNIKMSTITFGGEEIFNITDEKSVHFNKAQTLTEEEKKQARTNIGAVSAEEVGKLSEEIGDLKNGEELLCPINNYEIGTIDASGNPTKNSARIRSISTLSYDRDVFINIKDSSCSINLAVYNADGTFKERIIGLKNGYKIPKNTNFKVYIIHDPEVVITSVVEYANSVTISTKNEDRISNLEVKNIEVSQHIAKIEDNFLSQSYWNLTNNKANGANLIKGNYSVLNDWSNQTVNSLSKRISTKIDFGDVKSKIEVGFLKADLQVRTAMFDENMKFIGDSVSYVDKYVYSTKIRYVTIAIKKIDDAEITKDDVLNAGFYVRVDDDVLTIDEVLKRANELKDVVQNNILTLSVETEQSVTDVDIEQNSQYVIYPKRIGGRDLKVYAYDGVAYKQVTFTNLKSGNRTDTVYFIGKYLINDTYGCTKLKFVSERGAYSNHTVLDLIKYPYTPYVRTAKYEPKRIPNYLQKNVLDIAKTFDVSGDDVYYYEQNTIKKYNINDGTKTPLFTTTGIITSAMRFANGNIIFVDNSNHKMYLLKGSTVTEKHTFYNSNHNVVLEPNMLFSLHCYGDLGIVCEYNGAKEPISGYKAYITKDSGETWNILFDLESVIDNPTTRNYHLHSVVYDEYQDMYWACNGDAGNIDMIWYSLDGVIWNKTSDFCSIKPTEIIPTKECVLFLSDLNPTCVYKWSRDNLIAGDSITLDMVKLLELNWKNSCPIGSKAFYDRSSDIVYFGFYTDSNINQGFSGDLLKYCDVFATDGYKLSEVYKSDTIESCNGVFGNDKYIVISKNRNTVVIFK